MLLALTLACSGMSDLVVSKETGGIFIDDIVDTGAGSVACLDETARTTLEDWLYQTWLVAYGAPSTASASAVVAAYQLPGVPAAPWFSLSLASPCDAAHDLDPVCTGGVCYQVECTGKGGGWVDHIQNDPDGTGEDATTFDGWVVDRGRTPLTWTDGGASLALEYDIRSLLSPEGVDWTFGGVATFDGALDLTATFPGIYADGPVEVVIADDVGSASWNGWELATWEGQQLTAVESCLH